MPKSPPPPVPQVGLSLSLSPAGQAVRIVDLATRALVVAVLPPPRFGREAEVLAGLASATESGADLVEVPAEPRLLGPAAAKGILPIAARVTDPDTAASVVAAGAALLLVPAAQLDSVVDRLPGGEVAVAVLVGSALAARDTVAAAPDRPVALDAAPLTRADAVAEESLALAVGARLVRTTDVRRTRRVVEVMDHLLAARR